MNKHDLTDWYRGRSVRKNLHLPQREAVLYLHSTALSAGQLPREMYSRLMVSISGVCETC